MDLCKMFDVAENEEFYLHPYRDVFKVHNNLLYRKKSNSDFFEPTEVSVNFVARTDVVKAPFRPEDGQPYYTICNSIWAVKKVIWTNSPLDYLRKKQDMIFRTYDDAAFACPKIYEKLTGKNWEDYS